MTLHQRLFLHLLFPTLNNFLNPPYHHLIPNTTHDLQASSIPGRTSPDPSNTMPPPPNNDVNHNIYGCMVDVSKLTPAQRQQHAVMLIENYH